MAREVPPCAGTSRAPRAHRGWGGTRDAPGHTGGAPRLHVDALSSSQCRGSCAGQMPPFVPWYETSARRAARAQGRDAGPWGRGGCCTVGLCMCRGRCRASQIPPSTPALSYGCLQLLWWWGAVVGPGWDPSASPKGPLGTRAGHPGESPAHRPESLLQHCCRCQTASNNAS